MNFSALFFFYLCQLNCVHTHMCKYNHFQVAASMKKDVDAQIPNYPNLPSKLLCLLHNVTLHVCVIYLVFPLCDLRCQPFQLLISYNGSLNFDLRRTLKQMKCMLRWHSNLFLLYEPVTKDLYAPCSKFVTLNWNIYNWYAVRQGFTVKIWSVNES